MKKSIYDKFKTKNYEIRGENCDYQSWFLIKKLRWNFNYILSIIDSHFFHYPTPINLNYLWSFGSLTGISLLIQIVSGTFLAMHYLPDTDYAFASVERIMRDVPNGWFIRYVHSNGSSMLFIVLYIHILKGLYYGSYMHPRQTLWCSGVVLYILIVITAFLGYVLPWGQMSYWGATVVTNMVTIMPLFGKTILRLIWGGYTIQNSTLKRFYVLHIVLPFLIVGLTFVHLSLLHKEGSNNPTGTEAEVGMIPFYPYYFVKDLFAFCCFLFVYAILVYYYPNALGDPNNYIPADSMETPAHVVPEWYFWPFYAILRSVYHKAGGILVMLSFILVLFIIPFTNTSEVRSTTFRPVFKVVFWLLMSDLIVLGWIGQAPIKKAYVFGGQLAIVYYLVFFIALIPIVGLIEKKLNLVKLKDRNN